MIILRKVNIHKSLEFSLQCFVKKTKQRRGTRRHNVEHNVEGTKTSAEEEVKGRCDMSVSAFRKGLVSRNGRAGVTVASVTKVSITTNVCYSCCKHAALFYYLGKQPRILQSKVSILTLHINQYYALQRMAYLVHSGTLSFKLLLFNLKCL